MRFIATLVLFLYTALSYAGPKCTNGSSTVWSFNQETHKVQLKEIFSLEVCNRIETQEGANLELQFYNEDKLKNKVRVFWSKITLHDIIKKDKGMKAAFTKEVDYRVLKLPFTAKEVNRYEVSDINSGKILGQGRFK